MLGEGLFFLEGLEVVGLSFAIPLFQGSESASGNDDPERLPVLWVHQAFLLEVGEEFTLHLHIGVGNQLSGRYLFASNDARFGHRWRIY